MKWLNHLWIHAKTDEIISVIDVNDFGVISEMPTAAVCLRRDKETKCDIMWVFNEKTILYGIIKCECCLSNFNLFLFSFSASFSVSAY